MALWPTLGETLEAGSRPRASTRATAGAATRALDRRGGTERTGAPSRDQALFGGVVAGKNMDWVGSGNVAPRDAILRTSDMRRGILTGFLSRGTLLDTSI